MISLVKDSRGEHWHSILVMHGHAPIWKFTDIPIYDIEGPIFCRY
jgi:hypothetical protein